MPSSSAKVRRTPEQDPAGPTLRRSTSYPTVADQVREHTRHGMLLLGMYLTRSFLSCLMLSA